MFLQLYAECSSPWCALPDMLLGELLRPPPLATSLDLRASTFNPKDKVWTKFPPEGSKHTPPHQSCEFKWKDYCPLVFRTLRKLFKVVHRNLLQEPIVTQWAGSGCSSNTCTNGGVIRWQ